MTRVLAASLLALAFTTAQGTADDLESLDFTKPVPGWTEDWFFGPFDPERPNEFTITNGTTTHTVQFGGPPVEVEVDGYINRIAWYCDDSGYGYILITVFSRKLDVCVFSRLYGPYTP